MNNPKISVIVPVYNTDIYLEKCLQSLANQTLSAIEILCIDDGSTDNSAKIIKSYVEKDSRFKYYYQPNKGQSVARNLGMQYAMGKYIGFLDSDDWATSSMYEKLFENAEQFESDIAMCSITVYNENSPTLYASDPYLTLDLFPDSFCNRSFSFKDTLDFIFRICVTPWNKIYKKSYLEEYNFCFPEGISFEDNVFFLDTFTSTEKISLIKNELVVYRMSSATSYSHGQNDFKKLDFFRVLELEEKILRSKGLYDGLEDYFQTAKKNTLIYWWKKLRDESVKSIYREKFAEIYPQSYQDVLL